MASLETNKGEDYLKQAEKKISGFSLFPQSKKEEAVELFDKAAAQFKITKDWKKAGDSYIRGAEISMQLKNEMEAATFYLNAAKVLKQVSSADSIIAYTKCAQMHSDNNRFSSAAKMYQAIGELEEKEEHIDAALAAYEKSAECFQADNENANQILLKVAHFYAQKANYKKSVELFEKVGVASLDNRLTAYSVKDYLFKAGLCHLVMAAESGDVSSMSSVLDRYKDMDPKFDGSRELKLIENMVQSYQDGDVSKFTDVVFNYDRIYKLDNWTSSLLLNIKQTIQSTQPQIVATDNSGRGTKKVGGSGADSSSKHQEEPDFT